MNTETINREAADKSKGFRLQIMRAIKCILDSLEIDQNLVFYTAIENVEDISHTVLNGTPRTTYEEDKNYDESHNFTIFSPEVTNTLVSFFDIYVHSWRSSEKVALGFYTTASFGKERKKITVDGTECDLPDKPLLELLSSPAELTNLQAGMTKSVLLEAYTEQYKKKKSKGHLETLEEMSLDKFKLFLKTISWAFGEENEDDLKSTILGRLRNSKLFNLRLSNKENILFAVLMEKLAERQTKKNLAEKVLFAADVRLSFKEVESEEEDLVLDPTWAELDEIASKITDKRNLKEKILAVCPDYPLKKLGLLARQACRSKTEQISGNKSFLSLKYRIYEASLEKILEQKESSYSEEQIDKLLDSIHRLSSDHVEELKKDYKYTVSNKLAIKGIVTDLFDGCFVALDE